MKHWLRRKLINYLVRDLFNTITSDDVLHCKAPNDWYVGTRKINESSIKQLKAEAKSLERMYLWTVLTNEVKHQANEMIYNKSQTGNDLIAGKMLLYTVDILQSKVATINKT